MTEKVFEDATVEEKRKKKMKKKLKNRIDRAFLQGTIAGACFALAGVALAKIMMLVCP